MMVDQIVDKRTVAIPGPIGTVTPQVQALHDEAVQAAQTATTMSATTVELQDNAVSILLNDDDSATSASADARAKAVSTNLLTLATTHRTGAIPVDFWNFRRLTSYHNFFSDRIGVLDMTLGEGTLLGPSPSVTSGHGENLYPVRQSDSAHPADYAVTDGSVTVTNNQDLNTGVISGVDFDLGMMRPYECVQIDVDGSVLQETNHSTTPSVCFTWGISDSDRCLVQARTTYNEAYSASVTARMFGGNGSKTTNFKSFPQLNPPFRIMASLQESYIAIHVIKDGVWTYLGAVNVSSWRSLINTENIRKLHLKVGCRVTPQTHLTLSNVQRFYTNGLGQSNTSLVTYEDKTPIIHGQKAYISTTSTLGVKNYSAIYELDLTTFQMRMVSVLLFRESGDDDALIRDYRPCQILYDRTAQQWTLACVNFGWGHRIEYATSKANILNGVNILTAQPLNYATNGNEEDGSLCWDADSGIWRLAMCYNNGSAYNLHTYTCATLDGEWQADQQNDAVSFTGTQYVRLGGKLYIECGRCETWGKTDELRIYDALTLEEQGTLVLDTPLNSYNTWCTIIPIYDGSQTRYVLLTFDRNNLLGIDHTYGGLYFYESDFRSDLFEFDYRANANIF